MKLHPACPPHYINNHFFGNDLPPGRARWHASGGFGLPISQGWFRLLLPSAIVCSTSGRTGVFITDRSAMRIFKDKAAANEW
jgi:hypothetical protein